MEQNKPKKVVLEKFAFRLFDPKKTKNYINYSKDEFVNKVNELFTSTSQLRDGYAPFCKHIFISNFVKGYKPGYVQITPENEKLIKTKYEARTEKELPILTRYIPLGSVELQEAKYLDIILYSKEQIIKENKAMGDSTDEIGKLESTEFDYAIVSIKPQDVDYELPMLPITMMRNAVGIDQGGSGVPLEREKYLKSVKFWEKNIMIQ